MNRKHVLATIMFLGTCWFHLPARAHDLDRQQIVQPEATVVQDTRAQGNALGHQIIAIPMKRLSAEIVAAWLKGTDFGNRILITNDKATNTVFIQGMPKIIREARWLVEGLEH